MLSQLRGCLFEDYELKLPGRGNHDHILLPQLVEEGGGPVEFPQFKDPVRELELMEEAVLKWNRCPSCPPEVIEKHLVFNCKVVECALRQAAMFEARCMIERVLLL